MHLSRRLLAVSFLLGAGPITCAQCMSNVYGLGVEDATGKPFQADVQHTSPLAQGKTSIEPVNARIARDSEGRTRVDRYDGKHKIASTVGEGTEVDQHHICDPVAQQFIVLDTIDKTATVHKAAASNVGVRRSYVGTFCNHHIRLGPPTSVQTIEDLGHRTIEGFDAVGTLQKHTFTDSSINGNARQLINTNETWCSEELGAVLLRITGIVERGTTHTTTMSNIRRANPDPSLFQIPADYRVVETVNEPH